MPFKKLPGVLSLTRGLMITDAVFENQLKGSQRSPVEVTRHGIRGTQNIAEKFTEVSNIQQTETAKLDPEAQGMVVSFGISFLDLKDVLFACASSKGGKDDVAAYRLALQDFIERAKTSDGLQEIGRRFARNIANGRWLWRNRQLAESIEVTVMKDGESCASFQALNVPIIHFNDYTDDETMLGRLIAQSITGESSSRLTVEARIDFGISGALEVFPSQNYVERKPAGFARPLYYVRSGESRKRSSNADDLDIRVMGQAALRDQKVSNALRTFDTWYPSFADHGQPIAVEPNGANLGAQRFFREGAASAFKIALRLDELDPNSDDGMFMVSALMRGGVYSGSKE
ncbi:type I-F CRISPR-associated protein Csy3 [Halomonas sp. ISL-60]|uniref:type I-F CRISPR-associated protein Csy3 n=1 Tax=Halomonas sp. ISL-56 TaxID=2819149 RepID=UPI001BE84205|nr:type I-F CRISPR-associated protein Csy3 [Halomonas sp. ISL-56]MBT2770715.1 type I-F CRISPR-associated protein Csy3 [Halomonas sp. ISL-60]MBT2803921.1 type I-F CRISPR-associated protein Csy3 [Halomonas sp. ISL-56]